MSFSSPEFFLFVLGSLLLYYMVPQKVKPFILLSCNIVFYYLGGGKRMLCFLVVYILLVYGCGIVVSRIQKKAIIILCILLAVVPLLTTKYLFPLSGGSMMIPLGISFFSLQAVSYIVDIYKGKIVPEKNMILFAVYMSLFFYVLSGPIEKAGSVLPQLKVKREKCLECVASGLLFFCWGMFQKIVLAERLAQVVDYVYGDYTYFGGVELFLVTILYSFQLFFDFAGYSNMALGLARMFSIDIVQNFEQPYLSMSIAEFWRRWHISLSDWLKEYVYISCGGNRKGKVRKYINLVITFCVSGIWHGMGLNYMVWGILHAVYQIVGSITDKARKKLRCRFHIREDVFSYKFFKVMVTFHLVNFAWIFFRVPSLGDALKIIKRIVAGFHVGDTFGIGRGADYPWNISIGVNLTNAFPKVLGIPGISHRDANILILGFAVAIGVEIFHYKKGSFYPWLQKQNILFRNMVFFLLVFAILLFGLYGDSYNSSSFIYANF